MATAASATNCRGIDALTQAAGSAAQIPPGCDAAGLDSNRLEHVDDDEAGRWPHWRGVPDVRGEGSSTPSAYSGTWINRNAIERRERDVPVLQMTDETKRDLQYRERHDCHDRSRRKRAEHATELLTLVSDLFATLHQSNSKLFL